MYITIATLTLIIFILGTEKFGMVGLLPSMIEQLHITPQQASYLISSYSIGVVTLGPITIMLLKKINRKVGLMILVGLIACGNILISLASTYHIVLLGRFVSSIGHAAFSGMSSVIAFEIVPKDKRGLAISIITGGFTIANIFGVPISTYLSEQFNFNAAFMFISALSLSGIALVYFFLPEEKEKEIDKSTIIQEFQNIWRNKSVLTSLIITFVNYTALFVSITYMGVFIKQYLPTMKDNLPKILSIYGIGMTIGSLITGTLYDKFVRKTPAILIVSLVFLANLILPFSTSMPILSITCFVFIGGFGFGMVPFYKAKLIENADFDPRFASTFNICAINFGVIVGSFIAAQLIKIYPLMYVSLFSCGICVLTMILVIYNLRLDKNEKTPKHAEIIDMEEGIIEGS
jgi:DHA1 family inner membrane transport protein